MTPYFEAVQALHIAENHFDNADPDFLDSAISELSAALSRVSAETLHYKKLNGGKTS